MLGGGQAVVGFYADVGLLVELLGEVAEGEVRVDCSSRLVGSVPGAAVPEVAVEDDDVACAAGELELVAVGCRGVGHLVGGEGAAAVGAGDDAGRAVLGGEVVEEPDRVADLVPPGSTGWPKSACRA